MTPPPDPTALLLVPVGEPGGASRHVLDLTGHGVPGWRCVVLCPPGYLAERLRSAGTEVLPMPFGPDAGLRQSVRSLRAATIRLRPAVVHSHLAFADVAAAVTPLGSGVARVSTEHGIARDDAVHHRNRLESVLMRLVHTARLRRTDLLLAVSHSTAEQITRRWHPPSALAIRVVPNGVDRLPPRPAEEGLRLGALTRLAPEKGLGALLDAFGELRREHPEATLRIGGSGPRRAQIERRAAAPDVAGAVELLGHVEPDVLLDVVDVLVQLSDWENCSYSLLDAVARGLGVVATDVGGNAEVLPPHCLVPLGETTAAAACAVEQGLHPDRRPELAADWPSVAAMCATVGAAYDDLVGHR